MQEVDHEQRRQKVAKVAVDVIANEGLEAATVRNIAAKAGYSTTIITHYFNDKAELLLMVYHHITRMAVERLNQVTSRDPGDVLGALLAMTPIEKGVQKDWKVYIAFWQRAGHDPEFAAEQQKGVAFARDQISTIIRSKYGDHRNIPIVARHLIALIHGIAVQILFDQEYWSREEIQSTLARELAFLLESHCR